LFAEERKNALAYLTCSKAQTVALKGIIKMKNKAG
jgi:hypothetical protein